MSDTPSDRVIRRRGLPRHPRPDLIADELRLAADVVEKRGTDAITRASLLAQRGFPTATIGDGGSRGTDPTSSTERAALKSDRWGDADIDLAALLRVAWAAALELRSRIIDLMAYASDDDPVPGGTGPCGCGCGRFCDPRKNQHDRLKTNLAPACYASWKRSGLLRGDWLRARAKERSDHE